MDFPIKTAALIFYFKAAISLSIMLKEKENQGDFFP
jgi:hypothetical protein